MLSRYTDSAEIGQSEHPGSFSMSKDAARLVLVVEDDVSVRRPLVKFLEMHGFAVVTAETSDEGLDALRKHKLVAAVVDLRLRRGSRSGGLPFVAAQRAGAYIFCRGVRPA